MAYEKYSASSVMIKSPREQHREIFQAFVDEQIVNAHNWENIKVEKVFGTGEYSNINVRITHAINPDTGTKLSDDWKQLIFQNPKNKNAKLGKRYMFEENVWLTVNVERYVSATENCIVRRCNNTLNFVLQNGQIHKEPCAIENNMNSTNTYFNNAVNVPQGTIVVWLQLNKYTKNVNINDRFTIGYNKVFKVESVINFLSDETMTPDGSNLLKLTMKTDSILSSDDFINGITQSSPSELNVESGYDVRITPSSNYIVQSDTVVFTCYCYINDTQSDDEFEFSLDGNTVPQENYIFNVIDGNSFSVQNKKKYGESTLDILCTNVNNSDIYITKKIQLGGVY